MKTPWTSNRHPCFQTLRERVGFGRTGHKQVLSHPDLFWSLLYICHHVILETLVLHFHSQSSESDILVWGLPPEASGDTKRLGLLLYLDFSLNLRKPLKWLLITHSSSSSSLFLNRFSYLVPTRGPYNQGLEVPFCFISSVQFSHSVVSDSLQPHESQHARPPWPSPTPGVHWDSRKNCTKKIFMTQIITVVGSLT